MAQDHESSDGGADGPETFDDLVLDAMSELTDRIALEQQLGEVESRIAAFPDAVVAEALKQMGAANAEPEKVTPPAAKNSMSFVPRPHPPVD